MDLGARTLLLESAGLTVLDEAWSEQAPEPMAAWRPMISVGATPVARIHILEGGGHLPEVQARWEEIAGASGLFGSQGEFLVSAAGKGAAIAPWARVRRTQLMNLAQWLAPVRGEPEFVAMSVDGRVVCGVTTEEYDVWILAQLIS